MPGEKGPRATEGHLFKAPNILRETPLPEQPTVVVDHTVQQKGRIATGMGAPTDFDLPPIPTDAPFQSTDPTQKFQAPPAELLRKKPGLTLLEKIKRLFT